MYSWRIHWSDQHHVHLAVCPLPFCPTTTSSVCLRLSSYVFVYCFCEHTWAPKLIKKCFRIAIEWWNHKSNFLENTWNPQSTSLHTHPYQTLMLINLHLAGVLFLHCVIHLVLHRAKGYLHHPVHPANPLLNPIAPTKGICFFSDFSDSGPTEAKLAKNGKCYIAQWSRCQLEVA